MNTSPHTYIECECGAHAIRIESEIDYNEEQTFYLDIYNHQNIRPSLLTRIKLALEFIFTGKATNDHIFLTTKEAKKMANFINNNT